MHKFLPCAMIVMTMTLAVVPATADAATNEPLITHPTGTKLALGSKGTTTNVGETQILSTAGAVVLGCASGTMTGEVTKNSTAANIGIVIMAASFASPGGPCTGFFTSTVDPLGLGTGVGQGWCLTSTVGMSEDEFQVLGGRCSEIAKKIKFRLTGSSGECEYESTSTVAIRGTYTTDTSGDAVFSTPRGGHTATEDSGFTKIRDTTPFSLCTSSVGLKMSFTLETDNATAEPFYISR